MVLKELEDIFSSGLQVGKDLIEKLTINQTDDVVYNGFIKEKIKDLLDDNLTSLSKLNLLVKLIKKVSECKDSEKVEDFNYKMVIYIY